MPKRPARSNAANRGVFFDKAAFFGGTCPNMQTEDILKDHIKTFDHLLIENIWKYT
ncbi:MAG: hypothetical protein LBT48_07495 [Prevotellaceae bacterium]|jgi:hypothetical protein|nr:hypothetical protein [Prevotellaceae bacterium]